MDGIPVTIIIDRHGRIHGRHLGLTITGNGFEKGAVIVAGHTTYKAKLKGADQSKLVATVSSTALPSGTRSR